MQKLSDREAALFGPAEHTMSLIAHAEDILDETVDRTNRCEVAFGYLKARCAGLIAHLSEMHKLRDETVRKEVHKALGDHAAATDDWSHFNRFCEM